MAENLPNPGALPTNSPNIDNSTSNQPDQPSMAKSYRQIMTKEVRPGMLFVGRYLFWKRDPTPLVLVSSIYKDGRIAGVNLHNLTLDDMRKIVVQYCNKTNFTYQTAIKGRSIAKGFRTYKSDRGAWLNNMVKVINCAAFLSEIGVAQRSRLITPSEVEKVRQQIQQQLRKQINPRADDLTNRVQQLKPTGTIPSKPASVPGNTIVNSQPNSGE